MTDQLQLPKLWPGDHDFAEDLRRSLDDALRNAPGAKQLHPDDLLRIVLQHGYGLSREDAARYAAGEMHHG